MAGWIERMRNPTLEDKNLNKNELGVITQGSLVEGLEMKLHPQRNIEDVKVGKFVVIEGKQYQYFSMITDVRLQTNNPRIMVTPPSPQEDLLRQILNGNQTYATINLRPMLSVDQSKIHTMETERVPMPVKSIPAHFAQVFEASEEDVARIFGSENEGNRYFNIGQPLDMEIPLCLDLQRFVERSNGIFGKTGTGKTFLTRLVLSGLIKNQQAVNFIFDMHSEYGWQSRKEGKGSFVKGLKQLFGSQVAIFTMDPESSRRRGVSADFDVYIAYEDILVEDIAPLQEELRLNPTAIEAAYLIVARYGRSWLSALLEQKGEDIKEFADELGAHPESVSALYRKLKRFEHFPFLVKKRQPGQPEAINTIMEYIQKGKHIALEFGQQNSLLCYLLVANIITRRIHELYTKQTEKYLASQRPEDEPRKLMITIEEAHKFLNPQAARQTIFGIIAREMRKYYVSLLVVDQRPSGIDDEVLSQLGTRITALLNDEKDIQAVLTGVSNTSGLRSVLASLDSKQQSLIIGHAVPMPVVIQTREYGPDFYKNMGCLPQEEKAAKANKEINDLF